MNIRRSLIFSFAEKYCRMVIQLASTMLLSRLLTPRDIGIVSIALVLIGLTHILRDFGVSNYLIQEKELSRAQVSTTFGITLLSSWIMGSTLALGSGFISKIYHEPGLQSVLLVLTLNFFLIPFGSLVLTLLRRDGNFRALYWISMLSSMAYTATSLILAWMGFGYMSMAWASVAGNFATTFMAYVQMPSHLGLRPGFSQWRRVVQFGSLSIAANLVTEVGSRGSDLVIGRLIGIPETGLFSKAGGLSTMFNENMMPAVWSVAMTKFANSHHSNSEIRSDFLNYTSYITAFGWPFFMYSGIMLYYIMRFLFGSQWDSAVPIGQILCVASYISVLGTLTWVVLVATGAMKANLRIQLPVQLVNLVLLGIGCMWGLKGVAYASIVGAMFSLYVSFLFLKPLIGVSLLDVLRASTKSFVVSLFCILPPVITLSSVGQRSPSIIPTLLVSAIGTGAIWLLAVFVLNHPIKVEITRSVALASQFLRARRPLFR